MENILICGYGVSGRAAARLAAAMGRKVIIADEHSSLEMRAAAQALRKVCGNRLAGLSQSQHAHVA